MAEVKACSCAADCIPEFCDWKCALRVVDELLATPGAVTGDDTDLLLDFRSLIRQQKNAEATLRVFCELRRRLEVKHYLAFYRLRSWLKNHLLAEVRACPAAAPEQIPVRLNFYCVEAVRRDCLCAAAERGNVLLAPRLNFVFRPINKGPWTLSAATECASSA